MRTPFSTVASLGFMLPTVLWAQVPMPPQQEIVINSAVVTAAEIQAVQQRMGIPAGAPIPSGRYWYDPTSGLWGMEGGPTMGQILPDLLLGGALRADASGGGTGVFINGREIHPLEAAYLRGLYGYVVPGRYWLNWQGIGGFEGGPALFNLMAAAASAGGGGYSGYTRRTPFGGIGGAGNCSYYLHPSGSSVMNC